MKPRILPLALAGRQLPGASWALSLTLTFLTLALGGTTASQETPPSIVQATRNAREHKSESTKPSKIFTNDDVGVQSSLPSASAIPPESSLNPAVALTPQTADCKNPDEDERLKTELQAAQEELDQIRRGLNYDPKVISDGDVDLKNFKPGSSGLTFGARPLLQAEPQAPGRVQEVILEERIASLKEASHVACDSPKDAGIQKKIDSAQQELKLLQREFDLDQGAYYSKTNYAQDATGKAKLDAEQQQIESLKSEIERLRDELSTPKTNQNAE